MDTRARILDAAKHLFQQRGYHGVGTAEILAIAKAPKGSMYHHFPEGKEQIAIEVVRTIQDAVLDQLRRLHAQRLSTAEITRSLARNMAQWLKATKWREGTLLNSVAAGSIPDLPKLHAAIRSALHLWQTEIAKLLRHDGWPPATAERLAHTTLATLEGAMLCARIAQSERILTQAAETIAAVLERPS